MKRIEGNRRAPRWPKAALVVAVLFVVWWYGLVYLHWRSWAVQAATRIIPFPAVVLNGDAITYHDLMEEMEDRLWLVEKQSEGTRLPDEEELLAQALDSLLREKAIEQLAARHDLSVSDEELQSALTTMQQGESDEAFEAMLLSALNVETETFVQEILRPFLLAQKLQTFVLASRDEQGAVLALAEQAQIRIDGGALFGTILAAAQKSNFTVDGGDYGYISRERLPEGWDTLLHMEEQSTSPVVETTDTFVVLVVEDIIDSTDDPQFHTKAIVFHKRGLDDVVDEYLEEGEVKNIIRGVE